MDTSQEYIKMCEKAEEIQGSFPKNWVGDNWFRFYSETVLFCPKCNLPTWAKYCCGCGKKSIKKDRYWTDCIGGSLSFHRESHGYAVWLPRQDQLQEMIKSKAGDALHRICEFHDATCPKWKYYSRFTSLEQLWLAFVMKEIYHKIWNGKYWVREEE